MVGHAAFYPASFFRLSTRVKALAFIVLCTVSFGARCEDDVPGFLRAPREKRAGAVSGHGTNPVADVETNAVTVGQRWLNLFVGQSGVHTSTLKILLACEALLQAMPEVVQLPSIRFLASFRILDTAGTMKRSLWRLNGNTNGQSIIVVHSGHHQLSSREP